MLADPILAGLFRDGACVHCGHPQDEHPEVHHYLCWIFGCTCGLKGSPAVRARHAAAPSSVTAAHPNACDCTWCSNAEGNLPLHRSQPPQHHALAWCVRQRRRQGIALDDWLRDAYAVVADHAIAAWGREEGVMP